MDSFADRLSKAIKIRKITQSELSRRTGIGRNSISDYVNGKYEAKQDYLIQLAKALNVSEAWLIGEDIDINPSSILPIYNQLNRNRQNNVINFAKTQLAEQNNRRLAIEDSHLSTEIETLAAHTIYPNKEYTKEEVDSLLEYLEKIKATNLKAGDEDSE